MQNEEIFTSKQLSSWGMLSKVRRELLIDERIAKVKYPDKETFNDIQQIWLKESGINSEEDLRKWEHKQSLSQQDWQGLLIRRWRWLEWCKNNLSDKVPSHYLRRKSQIDKVTYSLIRVKDEYLANELFLRIKNRENTFEEIASKYSEGAEKQNGGKIGPISLDKPHPLLSRLLQVSNEGQLWPPKELGEWWIIVKMEKLLCTELNEEVRQKLLLELGEEELAKMNLPKNESDNQLNKQTDNQSNSQSDNQLNKQTDNQSNTIHLKL